MVANALLYNKSDSAIYRAASRLKKNIPPIYAVLDKERVVSQELSNGIYTPVPEVKPELGIDTQLNGHTTENDEAVNSTQPLQDRATVGDLEPPMDVLELLTVTDIIKPDLTMDLQEEPLQSLFRYELAVLKPPPTPVPPPPPRAKKPKRDRKAEYERAKAKKAAAAAAAMATAAEALTLLNGGHNRHHHHPHNVPFTEQDVARPHMGAQGHLPPSPLSPAAHVPPSFTRPIQQDSLEFRMPMPNELSIDTNMTVYDRGAAAEPSGQLSPSSPRSERPPRRKRPSMTLPGRSEVPPVVSDVDNRDSFKMFDAGWILPPDHKRGGRLPPVDRSTQPPPRKRAKTGVHVSHQRWL